MTAGIFRLAWRAVSSPAGSPVPRSIGWPRAITSRSGPSGSPPSRAELVARAADAEGLLTLLTDKVDAALLERCPRVRAISNYAVGYDNIDLAAAAARGIPVGNTPDVLTDATADLTFTLLLAAARQLPEAIADVRDGDWVTWEPGQYLGPRSTGPRSGSSDSGGSGARWRGGRPAST